MKAKLLIVGLITAGIVVVACKKDQFTTKPQLTFKSINAERVPKNTGFSMKLDVTDKEGDISDTMYIQRVYLSCTAEPLTLVKKVPDFASHSSLKAEIDISFWYGDVSTMPPGYNTSLPNGCTGSGGARVDSGYYRFWIRDKAMNISDTVNSPIVVLEE